MFFSIVFIAPPAIRCFLKYITAGFWRLKDLEDPWVSRPETPRTPAPDSPRKRASKSSDDEEELTMSPAKKQCTSPIPALTPLSLDATSLSSNGDKLEKEVAILREQLAHMTESMANLSHEVRGEEFQSAYQPQPVYHHNRVWEENYAPFASVVA